MQRSTALIDHRHPAASSAAGGGVIGFSELIGNWLVILGLLTPLGTMALADTMATAAYQHMLTA